MCVLFHIGLDGGSKFLSFVCDSGTDGDKQHLHGSTVTEVHDGGMMCRLPLPIFGLAVYKFKNSDWTQSGVGGIEKVSSLMNATENWLRSLNVYHPDFVFFKNHDFWR